MLNYYFTISNAVVKSPRLSYAKNTSAKVLTKSYCSNVPKNKEVSEKSKLPFESSYHPTKIESFYYSLWESRNYFKPRKKEESFVMLLPPPNVTGTLHLGHALTCTLQDVHLRWKRMNGESVAWIPGIDHAGIATQVAVEKYLKETFGYTRHSLGREKFLKKVWEWKNEKGNRIVEQLRILGASLDWSKLIFTMDDTHSKLVTDSFIKLFDDGLIYRKESLINWSCALKSSISDIEIDWLNIEKKTMLNVPGYEKPVEFGKMYDFAYKVCNEDMEVIVSTTRPETMLGDVAVAIHSTNPNASKLKGKQLWHPFREEKIPVIIDDFVDPEMGTGAVKITPSHSPTDFEVARRHNLTPIQVINEDGLINKVGHSEVFHGMKRYDARIATIKELKKLNLFKGSKPHRTKVPVCSRSGDVIEYLLKEQWFLKCESLSEQAANAVRTGKLNLRPKSYENVWYNWLESKPIRDWNLSRQLWWGHRIPMFKCRHAAKEVWVAAASLTEAETKATEMLKAPLEEIEIVQDSDVLDTWFSSGILTLNPAVNPNRKPPVSLMVTGHDILFFWVARMVMLSIQLTGSLPFNDVFLHSLITDEHGKKMSKSLGNVIDPSDVIYGISSKQLKARLDENHQKGLMTKTNYEKAVKTQMGKFPKGIPECGTDALRATLCSAPVEGHFVNFDVDMCVNNRFFCNKMLNAMSYHHKMVEEYEKVEKFQLMDLKEKEKLTFFDKWVLSKLAVIVESVEKNIASDRFYLSANPVQTFVKKELCNVYLNSTKCILYGNSPPSLSRAITVFFTCFETSLRLLAPFMPFITEHLYQSFPPMGGFEKCESITVAKYPILNDWVQFMDKDLNSVFEKVLDILNAINRVRLTLRMKNEQNAAIKCPDEVADVIFGDANLPFKNMAKLKELSRTETLDQNNSVPVRFDNNFVVFIKHEYNKASLSSLLNPVISKESQLKQSLETLTKVLEDPKWEELSHREKLRHHKEMSSVNFDLCRIEEYKIAINHCTK